jgi:hypothetical protein
MLRPPHPEGGVGAVRVEVRGNRNGARHVVVAGVAEYAARVSAAVASSLALRVVQGQLCPGLHLPGAERELAFDVVGDVRAAGIKVMEYVGSEVVSSW